MKKVLEDLYLKRNQKIIFRKDLPDENSVSYASTVLVNLNSIGYTLSKAAYTEMCKMPSEDIVNLYQHIMPILKDQIGANRVYQSFYPNFPEDSLNKEDGERFYDQLIHYVGTSIGLSSSYIGKPFVPSSFDFNKIEKFPLTEKHEYKTLDMGTEKDFYNTIQNLMTSAVSLSAIDKFYLKTFIENTPRKTLESLLPETIPNKENLSYFSSVIIDTYYKNKKFFPLNQYYKTTTDVLRLATALSDGDITLATNSRFKLNRAERNVIMSLLKDTNHNYEDISRYAEKWKRLGEVIHPNSYDESYNKEKQLFSVARESLKVEKFLGKVNRLIKEKDDSVLELLKQRPGIFAERLNQCIRTFDANKVINSFDEVAKDVSIPVLIRVKNKFEFNMNDKDFRVFNPKGKPCFCNENTQENLPSEVIEKVTDVCRNAMISQFSQKESLGKVYIDDSIKGYALPMQMREKNEGTRSIAEGSLLKSDEKNNYIRPFIWWTNNEKDRVDIDLSVSFFDENYKYLGCSSYYDDYVAAVHSGDITDGGNVEGNGVAEFIDIDKEQMQKHGARYAVTTVNLYSGVSSFKNLEHASFGFMERERELEGEAFEPSTVSNKIDLTSNATCTCPCIYDLQNEHFIWLDKTINQARSCSNVNNSLGGIAAELYSATQMQKPQLYDFVQIHAEARGQLVDNPKEANVVFALERGDIDESVRVITPFDDVIITGEFMDNIYRDKNVIDEIISDMDEIEVEETLVEEKPPIKNMKNIFNRNSDYER